MAITYNHLNGGYYRDGFWLCAYTCLAGLLCSLLSLLLLRVEEQSGGAHRYTRLDESTFILHSNNSSMNSVGDFALVHERINALNSQSTAGGGPPTVTTNSTSSLNYIEITPSYQQQA